VTRKAFDACFVGCKRAYGMGLYSACTRNKGRHRPPQPKRPSVAIIPNGCDLDLFRPGKREDLDLPGIGPHDCVACRFLDPIPKNQLNRLVSCCDIGMMILADVPAFYYGTSPNKFFDYISSGIPVLNNYPGRPAEMIRKHQCGEALPPRNPEAFADALCKLADNPELRRQYCQNAGRLAEERFSREILAGEFVRWIEEDRK
jgi:glycosyltransferase involved in cell wall biosynthesis